MNLQQAVELLERAKAEIIRLEQELAQTREALDMEKQAKAELENFKEAIIRAFDLVEAEVVPPFTSLDQALDAIEKQAAFIEMEQKYLEKDSEIGLGKVSEDKKTERKEINVQDPLSKLNVTLEYIKESRE